MASRIRPVALPRQLPPCHNAPVPPLKTVRATRYVTPLREGGSLPAIVEADDDGLYVLKFRGAGQGARALIAELVSGEIARRLGLPVPDLVLIELDADLARTEHDPEIFALLRASAGLNLALDYLPGSVMFDPVAQAITADLASRIVWFDAYVTNVDRTPRNTNMLLWHRQLWLIDHGATLYFHHTAGWEQRPDRARETFPLIKDHVLLPAATRLEEADAALPGLLTPEVIAAVVALVPDGWLDDGVVPGGPEPRRAAYRRYLIDRVAAPRAFVEEAVRAR
jgi:hypothetical protein